MEFHDETQTSAAELMGTSVGTVITTKITPTLGPRSKPAGSVRLPVTDWQFRFTGASGQGEGNDGRNVRLWVKGAVKGDNQSEDLKQVVDGFF